MKITKEKVNLLMAKFKEYLRNNIISSMLILILIFVIIIFSISIKKNVNLFCSFDWQIAIVLITLLGSAYSTRGSIITNKQQRTIEVITSNRVLWMKELKEIVHNLKYELDSIYRKIEDTKDISYYYKLLIAIEKHHTNLELHLNINGKQDIEILNQINAIRDDIALIILVKKAIDEYSKKLYSIKRNIYFVIYSTELFKNFIESIGHSGIEDFDICSEIKDSTNLIINKFDKNYSYSDTEIDFIISIIENQFDKFKIYENKIVLSIEGVSEKIIKLTQIYLKVEWERVKYEAENGLNKDFDCEMKFKEYKEKFNI